jgi:XTP/dITP diphosphohydrolase
VTVRRRFSGDTLILATHNKGKAAEIAALLDDYVDSFPTSAELSLPEPAETENTFIGNAILKARVAAKESGLLALADDSGLSVTALNGAPGIYSARWAGPKKDFHAAMERVNRELGNAKDRSAAFICALAIGWPDGHAEAVEGRIDGQLIWPPRGDKGFGYDPIFIPDGYDRTFAEIPALEKRQMSHRARAFAHLVKEVF